MSTSRLPTRTQALIVVLLVWGAVGIFISLQLGWPARYGVHCPPRYCFAREVWNSGLLLHHRNPLELLLFGWLWSWAAIIVYFLILPIVRGLKGGNA